MYRRQIGADTSAHVRALKYWTEYGEPDNRDIEIFVAEGGISSRLTDKYDVSVSIDYRDQEDSKSGDTNGFQFESELRYSYRQLSVITGVDFSFLKRNELETDSVFWYLRLKRTF